MTVKLKRLRLRRLLFESLERRIVLSSIHGHKFWDFNRDGADDFGEPGLDGVAIKLLNSDGLPVLSTVTNSLDVDQSGDIDPETESGLFWFTNVPEGVYTLVEEDVPGFNQTFPAELSFAISRNFAAGPNVRAIKIADVNNDAVADFVLLDGDSLVVRLGLEGFRFGAPFAFQIADAQMLDAVGGDFDGGGFTDFAVTFAHPTLDQTAIFLNQGVDPNGNWLGFAFGSEMPVGQFPRTISSDDFNRDGATDLVVASDAPNEINVLLGNGQGGFTQGPTINLPPPVVGPDFTFGFVASGDLNLDGLPDLIADGPDQLITLLNSGLNSLDGSWLGFAAPIPSLLPGRPLNLKLADLDNDQALDVAYTDVDNEVVGVLRNTSIGDGTVTFAAPAQFNAGPLPAALDIADLNRDGLLDLVVGNAVDDSTGVRALLANGPVSFSPEIAVESGPKVLSVALGDTNGDGNVDILAGRSDGSVDPLSLIANTQGQYTIVVPSTSETIEGFSIGNAGQLDWGDAPDSFRTVLVSNGPRHRITDDSPRLGSVVTPEVDGAPHPEAAGDGGDDGIFFPLPLLPGVESAVTVFPNGSGIISGWLDLNGDGVFDNTPIEAGGEKIINNVSIGSATSFLFDIPADAVTMDYSRFRFSTTGGLGPFGGALPDGEVEDHMTLDYGDAPESYGTSPVSNGPRHRFAPDVWLGSSVDVEQSGRPHAEARGDDLDGNDDEDGVSFPLPMIPGQESAVAVEPSTRGFLFGWIDFDGDGVFNENSVEAGGEKIFDGVEIAEPSSLQFTVPDTATDLKYARFRFTSVEGLGLASTGLSDSGMIPDGEVEDYALLDFGDAPDSYGTSLTSDGPRHFVMPNVFLGASEADIELDGQPHAEAQGDDGDNMDDEDGVTFLTPLVPGEVAEIEVDPSMAGFLFGWIDFNDDGQFQDSPLAEGGERVFSGQALTSAANQRFTFTVPVAADVMKFARFRYTTESGLMLGPTGVKPDGTPPIGEVEDYALLDFGDASASDSAASEYPTLREDDGARHFISSLYLGTVAPPADAPTIDDDGQPNRAARRDDNEKSVKFTSMIVPGTPAEIKVTASKAGKLDAFVDWNVDGDWLDAGERIFDSKLLDAGENTLTFQVPDQFDSGIKYLRFRISQDGGLGPDGLAADGEVEDYALGGVVNSTDDESDLDLTDGVCDTGELIDRQGSGSDTEGEPECTLRAAIEQSNALGASTTIEFDIPRTDEGLQQETGSFKITVGAVLPGITKSVEIDGSTQPGYIDKPLVEVDGFGLQQDSTGIHILAGETTVRGLAVNGFSGGKAILIEQEGHNLIESNFLGTDVLGAEARANAVGVSIVDSAENSVRDNLISGNSLYGVEIFGSAATQNRVVGNLIGTDVDGMAAIPNQKHGVVIREASSNSIGGIIDGERNVISGNGDNSTFTVGGVLIQGTSAQMGNDARNNLIEGNIIGPNKNGDAKLTNSGGLTGNRFVGIAIVTASNNTIGGADNSARNIISGNLRGIHIEGTSQNSGKDASGNKVQGNFIGLTKDGEQKLGNSDTGVRLVDARGNVVGGVSQTTGLAPGNVISANLTGVDILGAGRAGNNSAQQNLIQGNLIGTNHNATVAVGNFTGIAIRSASNNTIGGAVSGMRNVISGNQDDGVTIRTNESPTGEEATGNLIHGNFIGVGIGGLRPGGIDLGNGGDGIDILDAKGNLIGGPTTVDASDNPTPGTAPGNIISDNNESGIVIRGQVSEANVIQGNVVGADVTGTLDLGNRTDGVALIGAPRTRIGGTDSSSRNLISGNDVIGVRIVGPDSRENQIQGNYIGTRSNGSTGLGNGVHGIYVALSNSNVIGGTQDTIPGMCKGACNVIAFNGASLAQKGHGVVIASGLFNRIQRNSIFDNAGRGIDLGNDSFTLNDVKDDDTGANNLQDYPVVTSVAFAAPRKSITWTLNSTPNQTYTLEYFVNANPDPSGFGEGQHFVASENVTTNDEGNVSDTLILTSSVDFPFVSATATDAQGNTSEFSMVDTDGDAIADAWETQRADVDNDGTVEPWEMGILDIDEDGTKDHLTATFLPAMGGTPAANLYHKDVYVEVDLMEGVNLAQPNQSILNVVANGRLGRNEGFANAPNSLVQNPDTLNGISLHAIISDTNLPSRLFSSELANEWREFDALKRIWFGSVNEFGKAKLLAAKKLVYRYAIFGDKRTEDTHSGLAELPPESEIAFFGGNDFYVTLGGWTTRGGTIRQQQGTFMHELGHTLGILHGGGDHSQYKPNYPSVMNYLWQNPKWYSTGWSLDYSRVNFGSLNENGLNETQGVITTTDAGERATAAAIAAARRVLMGGETTTNAIFDQLLPVQSQTAAVMNLVVPMFGTVDWSRLNLGPFAGILNILNVVTLSQFTGMHDNDGNAITPADGDTGLMVDINGDGQRTNLAGHEDWSKLRFYFRESAQGAADGVHENSSDEEDSYNPETEISMDFGDAPSEYPTLFTDDGARHIITGPNNPLLGQRVDLEGDGTPDPQASADDDDNGIDLSSDATPDDPDDEDGVSFNGPLVPGENATFTVNVLLPDGVLDEARLDAWIDFNADGDWDDLGEQVFESVVVLQGENELFSPVPTAALAGTTFARFRLSTAGGLLPTGEAVDGEVEDYPVVIAVQPDVNIHGFGTTDTQPLSRISLVYEVLNSQISSTEIGFFGSNQPVFDTNAVELGERLTIAGSENLTPGLHTMVLDRPELDAALIDSNTKFLLIVMDPDNQIVESDESNNGQYFVGVFIRPASPSPLVVRGYDSTGPNASDSSDVVTITENGGDLTVDFNGASRIVALSDVSNLVIMTHGGDDLLAGDTSLPLVLNAGPGNDVIRLTGSQLLLDLVALADADLLGLETIDITGSGANSLALSVSEIMNLWDDPNLPTTVLVRHDEDDSVSYGSTWVTDPPVFVDAETRHRLHSGDVVLQIANTRPWQNPIRNLDTSRNGQISALDVLLIINTINSDGARPLREPGGPSELPEAYYDTSGDNFVSAVDTLLVINFLNSSSGGSPEGEYVGLPLSDDQWDWYAALSTFSNGLPTDRSNSAFTVKDDLRNVESIDDFFEQFRGIEKPHEYGPRLDSWLWLGERSRMPTVKELALEGDFEQLSDWLFSYESLREAP